LCVAGDRPAAALRARRTLRSAPACTHRACRMAEPVETALPHLRCPERRTDDACQHDPGCRHHPRWRDAAGLTTNLYRCRRACLAARRITYLSSLAMTYASDTYVEE